MTSNSIMIIICTFLLLGCQPNEQTISDFETEKQRADFLLKQKEWYTYIDSISTVSFNRKVTFLDSLSKYYMKDNTPNIISDSKYIFWRNGSIISYGDFDFFEQVTDSLFLIGSRGKRNIIINECRLTDSTLKEMKKVVFDLNKSEINSSCLEICGLKKKLQNQKLKLSVKMFNDCYNVYLTKIIDYNVSIN